MAEGKKAPEGKPGEPPIGVVLVNFGMPEHGTRKVVAEYLKTFLKDRRVSRPLETILYQILRRRHFNDIVDKIARRCSEMEREHTFNYHETGTRQRRAVMEELERHGLDNVAVTMAYRYSTPTVRRSLTHLSKLGCTKIIVMPLYPQSSYAFTSSVSDLLRREKIRLPRGGELRFIEGFHKNSAYIEAMADNIEKSIGGTESRPKLVFAFRAIPVRDALKGDTYETQTSASALAIAKKLGLERKEWTIAYIPYEHLGEHSLIAPTIYEAVERFHIGKVRDVAVVCPGKLTDSLETLYDIDTVMRRKFEGHYENTGDSHRFTYIPALNDSPAFARLVASVLYKNMTDWIGRPPAHVKQ